MVKCAVIITVMVGVVAVADAVVVATILTYIEVGSQPIRIHLLVRLHHGTA